MDNSDPLTYEIVVDNSDAAEVQYNLYDSLRYDGDVVVDSVNYITPDMVTHRLTIPLDNETGMELATDSVIAAMSQQTYRVCVFAHIELDNTINPAGTVDGTYDPCTDAMSGGPGQMEYNGLFNESYLDGNDDGMVDQRDTACADLPMITHTKMLVGTPELQPDGNYKITYEIVVDNSDPLPVQYNLYDSLRYDGDVVVDSVNYITPDMVTHRLTIPLDNETGIELATDSVIAALSQHTYRVCVFAHIELDNTINPAGTVDGTYDPCADAMSGGPGQMEYNGLFNESYLDGNDDGMIDQRDTACADLPMISHTKMLVGTPELQPDGNYKITYEIVVDNSDAAEVQYNLYDSLRYDGDVVVDSVNYITPDMVTHRLTIPLDNETGMELATDSVIAAMSQHTYRVCVFAHIELDNTINPSADGTYLECNNSMSEGQDQMAYMGLFNESVLDMGSDGTPEEMDTSCANLPMISHTKTLIGAPELQDSGNYKIIYQIVVENADDLPVQYDLFDSLRYDGDVVVDSINYITPDQASHMVPGVLTNVTGMQLAADSIIGAMEMDTFVVCVYAHIDLDNSVNTIGVNGMYDECINVMSEGSGHAAYNGLFNESTLDMGGDGSSEEMDTSCADLPMITHTKMLVGTPILQPAGNHKITYEIIVDNSDEAPVLYSLYDSLRFDGDVVVDSINYITPDLLTTSVTGNLTNESGMVLAIDSIIPAMSQHVYRVCVYAHIEIGNSVNDATTVDGEYDPCIDPDSEAPQEAYNGLFNESYLDTYDDGMIEERDTACTDLPPYCPSINCYLELSTSLGPNCLLTITPEMFIIGEVPSWQLRYMTIELRTLDGLLISGNTLDARYLGHTIQVIVTVAVPGCDMGTCMTMLTLKGNKQPRIVGSDTYTVYCTDPLLELDPGSATYAYKPTAEICSGSVGPVEYVGDWIDAYECDNDTAKVIIREWQVFASDGTRATAIDTIIVLRYPEIDLRHIYCGLKDTVYCSDTLSQVGPFITVDSMNSGICDTTYLVEVHDVDQDGMLEFVPKQFASKCGLKVHVDYEKFGAGCDVQYKVVVDIKQDCFGPAQSTCTVSPPAGTLPNGAESLGSGYWRCEFWVSDLDTLSPDIEVKHSEEWLIVYTEEHECAAHAYVPTIRATDDWSGIKMVKVMIRDVGTALMTFNQQDSCWESHVQFTLPKRETPYTIVYEAYDSCHNVGYDSVQIHVKDNVRPVAVADKGLTISLNDKKAWIDAASFDEGSWDNCGVNLLLARRVDWYESCIDLCDSLDVCWIGEHHDTIWQAHLDIDKHDNEVEAYYAKTLAWLCDDGIPCGDIVYNSWIYDLMKYGTKVCRDHPYELSGGAFRKLADHAWYEGLSEKFKGGYFLASGNGEDFFAVDHQTGETEFLTDLPYTMTEIQYDKTVKKMYGSGANGVLYELDIQTGSSLDHIQTFSRFPGMEFVEHMLYVTTPGDHSSLYKIDPFTGDTVHIGSTGFPAVAGMAYDRDKKIMYGITARGVMADLITIDLLTGQGTLVGSTGYDYLGSLAFGPDGKLYATSTDKSVLPNTLFTVDVSSGAASVVGEIGYSITGLTLVDGDETVEENLDLYEQIGGGWSDAVPLSCDDACGPVTVEILVMDYWCNWNKSWTNVWVEDKTPITVAQDVVAEESITCKTYKDERYAYEGESHPVSLDFVVEQAKEGEQAALYLLDEVFGGYEKAWLDTYGNYVDIDGHEIDGDIAFYDSICECTSHVEQVRVYDEHLGYRWKDSLVTSCYYESDTLELQRGIVVVNCSDNVECTQEVWSEFDHCGQGYIFRKFKMWQGCPDTSYVAHQVPDSSRHNVDTIYRYQRIWVKNTCALDKHMFDVPLDTTVYSCSIEYNSAQNVVGAAGPENTGQATYKFDDDCRLVGLGHRDKIYKIVGGDGACYKIYRTWYFADWCSTGGSPVDGAWWYDRELVIDSCIQKILVMDTVAPQCVISGPVEDGGMIELGACSYDLKVMVAAVDHCGLTDYKWELTALTDTGTESTVDYGEGALDGDEDDFSIASQGISVGRYKLKVVSVDACENEGYCDYTFEVVSAKKPNPVCITSLTATLTPWDSDQDGSVDSAKAVVWASEFNVSSEVACSDTMLEYRIELIDGVDDDSWGEDTTLVSLGCVDIGSHLARLWVISWPSGTADYCDVVLIVQSGGVGCDFNVQEQGALTLEGETERINKSGNDKISLEIQPVTISGDAGVTILDQFILYQNRPNPWTEATTVGFELPEAGTAVLTIFDVSGRVVTRVQRNYAKGYHEEYLRFDLLGYTGVLYYQLETSKYVATKRMIIVQ